jgi:hypothetical protein
MVQAAPTSGTPTARLGLPVPAESDPADVPLDIGKLASALDLAVAVYGQGTSAARPTAGLQGRFYFNTDNGRLDYDNGSAWVPLVPPGYGSTLPTSPADGQEYNYVADATNGIVWRLRYNASSASTHKWELLGGSPLSQNIITTELVNQVNWTNPATLGPTLTPPLAGDYMVKVSVGFNQGANTAQGQCEAAVGIGGAAPAAGINTGVQCQLPPPGATGNYLVASLHNRFRMNNLAAGNALTIMYRDPAIGVGNGGFYVLNRYLEAIPVRVG